MKNLLIMGLTSLLLFSLAAGLSLYLQQNKAGTETTKEKDDEKKKSAKEKPEKLESPDKEKPSKPEPPDTVTAREREMAAEKRQARELLVLSDLRSEREAFEKLTKKLVDESKAVIAQNDDAELRLSEAIKNPPKPVDLTKKPLLPAGPDPSEQKNTDKLAAMFDAMQPDLAAKQLQEMSNSGLMETAVQILAKMKETKAAKVLESMTDVALSGQIIKKIQMLKKAAPAPPPGS